MARTKKAPVIPQHFMFAFEGTLKRKDNEALDEAVMDLEDSASFLDDDFGTVLPVGTPTGIQKQFREHVRLANIEMRKATAMLDEMLAVAQRIQEQREKEAERKLPHCKTCGQVVKSKKRK